MMIQFALTPDGTGKLKTGAANFRYALDNTDLMVQALVQKLPEAEPEWGEAHLLKWWMTTDLGLLLEQDDFWIRFLPSDNESLVAAGFNRQMIKQFIEGYRQIGVGFIETLTEDSAKEWVEAKYEVMVHSDEPLASPVT